MDVDAQFLGLLCSWLAGSAKLIGPLGRCVRSALSRKGISVHVQLAVVHWQCGLRRFALSPVLGGSKRRRGGVAALLRVAGGVAERTYRRVGCSRRAVSGFALTSGRCPAGCGFASDGLLRKSRPSCCEDRATGAFTACAAQCAGVGEQRSRHCGSRHGILHWQQKSLAAALRITARDPASL